MKVYTSKEILAAEDLYDLQELSSSGIPIRYQLTEGEIVWVKFMQGNYSISDYVFGASNATFLLTIDDIEEMSKFLDYDCKDAGKAVMLSDETALQKIFFWLYQEQ